MVKIYDEFYAKINKKVYFTTSWDDGGIYDMKLAELLLKYGIKATFYIPIKNVEGRKTLSAKQIQEISQYFEIGSHTYSHVRLTSIPYHIAREEIKMGKSELEQIVGKSITAFCPPGGKWNKYILQLAKKENFLFLRSTGYMRMKTIKEKNNNLLHTTLQFYPHKLYTYLISIFKKVDVEGMKLILENFKGTSDWNRFSRKLLYKCIVDGGVFHLWGHSWEIEELNLWGTLESFLKDLISEKNKIIFCINSEVWENENK